MSYLQPLITSAFATYPVSYRGRSVETVNDSENDPTAFSTAMANVNGPGSVAPIGDVEKSSEADPVRGEKTADRDTARDAGKPKSASGDVLDLSQEAKDVWENRSTARNEAVEEASAERNRRTELDTYESDKEYDKNADQAEADTLDNRISLDSASSSTSAVSSKEGDSLESGESDLTPEEQEQVEKLKARDAEVRIHEQTHVSVGGPYVTSGPSYTYETGPDGKKYAVGGSVGIDTGEIPGDPQATIQKMQTVARAALAPAEPSGQDQKVAAAARQKEAQARAELNQQNAEKASSRSTEGAANETVAASLNEPSESTQDTKSDIAPEAAKSYGNAASNLSKSSIGAYEARNAMSLSSAGSRFSAFA